MKSFKMRIAEIDVASRKETAFSDGMQAYFEDYASAVAWAEGENGRALEDFLERPEAREIVIWTVESK